MHMVEPSPTVVQALGQVVHVEEPLYAENVPTGQGLQLELPMLDLKDPGAQGSHGPPSGPENPSRHWQSVMTVLWEGLVEFWGHARHSDTDAADAWSL